MKFRNESTFLVSALLFGSLILYPLVYGTFLILRERYPEERAVIDLFHQNWYLILIGVPGAIAAFTGVIEVWRIVIRDARLEATNRTMSDLGMLREKYIPQIPSSWIYFGGLPVGLLVVIIYVVFFK